MSEKESIFQNAMGIGPPVPFPENDDRRRIKELNTVSIPPFLYASPALVSLSLSFDSKIFVFCF